MKNSLLSFFIAVLCFVGVTDVQSQCVFLNDNYPSGTFFPTNTFQVASTIIYGGEYSAYSVTAGVTYQWSLCAADGGSASYDSELTLWNSLDTNTPLASADQECGDDAVLTWTATFTGIVYVQVNEFQCIANATNTTMVYRSLPFQFGCPFNGNQFPAGTITPTSDVFTAASTNIYAGEYSAYNVTAGQTYEWSLCAADGGLANYDSQLSLYRASNTTTPIIFSDNACGDDAKITYLADLTETVYVQVNQASCLTNATPTTLVYRLNSNPQIGCAFGANQFPTTIFTPTSNTFTQAATNIYAGEHSRYNVTVGQTYEWSLCAADGGLADYDSELSLFNAANTTNALVYSDDACGDDAKITWTATFTGQVNVQVNQFNCATNSVNTTLVYRRVSSASAPSNDNCATATFLNVNQFCSPTSGTVLNATASTPTTTCLGTNTDDVWYAFTVNNNTQTLNFEITPNGVGFDPVFEIFTGTSCANLTSLLCVNNGGDGQAEGFFANPGIVPIGTTFYIRMYDFNLASATNPNFTVCAFYSDNVVIPGDECDNAIDLAVTTTCTNPVLGNYGDFTLSNSLGFDCQSNIVSDAWFTFDAISDSVFFNIDPLGFTDAIFEVYQGVDCASLQNLGCGNFTAVGELETVQITPTVPGDRFYLRLYDGGVNTAANLDFNICAFDVNSAGDPGPVNNECNNATLIFAGTSCQPFVGTLEGATASLPATNCGGTNTEDVWYQLVASDTSMIVEITPDFATLGIVAELFVSSTGDCNGLVSFGCADNTLAGEPEAFIINGLNAGESVWIRVYDFPTAPPANPTFTICAWWDASVLIPENDECDGAITLTPSATCNSTAFTTANATGSLPTTSCSPGGNADQDVWFKFVAQSTSAIIRVGSVNLSDPVIQYFSGSCANLVSRGCSDFFVAGVDENLTATGLTVGTTYYVRVYDYEGSTAGVQKDFTICIINNPTAPVNNNCSGAIPLTVSTPSTYQYFNTALATQSSAGCSGNANDDVWFSFVAGENPLGTQIEVGGDLDFSTVYQVYSGTCANLTSVQCVNNITTGNYDIENQTLTTLTPGQQYFIRAYDFDATVTNSTFYIRLTGTPVGCNLSAPVATANGSIDICGNGGVNISTPQVAGLSYQWRLNGNNIPGATANSYDATISGIYTVVISDASACTAESNAIGVQVTPQPIVAISAATSTTICTGGSVVLSTPTQPGITWQWFRNNIAINGATSASYSATQTGTYTLVGTSGGFCTGTSNGIDVNVISAPTAVLTAAGSTTICQGSNIILSVASQAGTTIQWKRNNVDIAGATESTYTASQAGAYTAVVSAGANCSTTSNSITINVVPGPTAAITAGSSTVFCQGGNVVLTAASVTGATYQWLNNGVPVNGATSLTYTASNSGSFNILVTTAACASTSNTIDVLVNPIPTAIATAQGQTTFCTGGSVTLAANPVAGAIYQWLNGGTQISGANSSTYNATASGSYTVNVISDGCLASSNAITVTVNPPPTATITANGSTTVCQGSTVTLNANAGAGLSYQWLLNGTQIGGANNASYTASTAGNYTVIVSQGSNCSSTSNAANVNILALPQISVTASGPLAICQGSSVSLTASPSAGNTFQWQIGGANISGATNASYAANGAGSYTVVATSSNGCAATSTPSVVTINPLPPASITPNGPTTFCVGGNVLLQANSGNGFNYQWQNGGNVIPGAVNGVLNVSTAGSYTVTVSDLNNCSATSTAINVNVAGVQAQISFTGQPAICDGQAVVLNANTDAGLTYVWSNNGNTIPGATGATYTATTGGNYTVAVTDLNNCTSTSAVQTITVGESPEVPVVTAAGPIKFCEGGSVDLSTPTVIGIVYQWLLDGNILSGENQPSITADQTGDFLVTAVNTSGCLSQSLPVEVEVYANPTVSFTLNPDTTCVDQLFALQGGSPAGGVYSGTNVDQGNFLSSTVGTYTITYQYTDANGCSASATDDLKVYTCSSIEELISSTIQLYPNPANELVTIEIPSEMMVNSIQMTDLSGRLVEVNMINAGNNRYNVPVANLASGTYQIVILTDEFQLVKRFVKTN